MRDDWPVKKVSCCLANQQGQNSRPQLTCDIVFNNKHGLCSNRALATSNGEAILLERPSENSAFLSGEHASVASCLDNDVVIIPQIQA